MKKEYYMKNFKEIFYACLITFTALLLIYWFGIAVAWNKQRSDVQRIACIKETHNPYWCNEIW